MSVVGKEDERMEIMNDQGWMEVEGKRELKLE